MTPKMRKKRSMIMVTFATLGIAKKSALTATFSSSFLLISLRNLSTLKTLTERRLSDSGVSERTENMMMMKSRTFQERLR